MTRWSANPEAAAQALITSALDHIAPTGRLLLAGAHVPLPSGTATVADWNRRFSSRITAQPSPPPGPFDVVLMRLPKSREEQQMTAHQCLGELAPGGRLIVYGGNDEGIRSFQMTLALLGPVVTLATRGHGRVLELRCDAVTAPIKSRLEDWRIEYPIDGTQARWISYPGLFAGGGHDAGTALLLAHLPPLTERARVLDYGCGPGAIAAACRRARPDADMTVLDNDSVALLAASQNAPGAKQILGDRLGAVGDARFDLIVSNPPLHTGFREDTSALSALIAEAARHLTPRGAMLLVVQRRIALERNLGQHFAGVEITADDGRYRVWKATGARSDRSRG